MGDLILDSVGERIISLRNHKGISQRQLAKNLNISSGNLSSYESNKIKPAAETIVAICKYFNVSTDWLLLGEEFDSKLIKEAEKITLNKNEINLIRDIRRLSEEDKKLILLLINRLCDENVNNFGYNSNDK